MPPPLSHLLRRLRPWTSRFACLMLLACAALPGPAPADDSAIIRLATTTSTENSGLMAYLKQHFEAAHPYQLHVIATGSGRALQLGERGEVDVLLVHAPQSERAFIAAGHGLRRFPVMHNDFVLAGPAADPAQINSAANARAAFARIAEHNAGFVSRGDQSGTHKKEQSVWKTAGITPSAPWYLSTGQGMSRTLLIADQLQAYVLTDRGTWLARRAQINLPILYQGDSNLKNPYSVIAINPARHPINHTGAQRWIEWLTSAAAKQLINGFVLDGQQLFIAAP